MCVFSIFDLRCHSCCMYAFLCYQTHKYGVRDAVLARAGNFDRITKCIVQIVSWQRIFENVYIVLDFMPFIKIRYQNCKENYCFGHHLMGIKWRIHGSNCHVFDMLCWAWKMNYQFLKWELHLMCHTIIDNNWLYFWNINMFRKIEEFCSQLFGEDSPTNYYKM